MTRRSLATLGLGLLLVGVLGWLLLGGVGSRTMFPDIDVTMPENLEVDMLVEGVTLTHGEDGRMVWRLVADKADYDKDEALVDVVKPVVRHFDEEGGEAVMTAPLGRIDRDKQTIQLWPGVEIVKEETVLNAEAFVYDYARRMASAAGDVLVTRPDMVARSDQVVAFLDHMIVTAQGNVRVDFQISEEYSTGEMQ
jgi:LPS export ABC transporter protein LptC